MISGNETDPFLLIRDPVVARPRGRPTGSRQAVGSTQRDPSLSEIVALGTQNSEIRSTHSDCPDTV